MLAIVILNTVAAHVIMQKPFKLEKLLQTDVRGKVAYRRKILLVPRFDGVSEYKFIERKEVRFDVAGTVGFLNSAEDHGHPRESGVPSKILGILNGLSC